MQLFIDCLWVFFACAFIGWLIQYLIKLVGKHDHSNTGFITLPFSPAYGLGGVFAYLAFHKSDNPIMVFFGGLLLLTLLKFIMAMLFEKTFGFKWIDYSNKKFNLNGYVTIFEALIYGVVSVICVYLLFPFIGLIASAITQWISLLISGIIVAVIITDFMVSVVSVIRLRKNLKQMKNISELLQEEQIEDTEKLVAEYEKKLFRDKKFRKRLIKTFPDMEFADYEKQFTDLKIKYELIIEKNNEVYSKKVENKEDEPFAFGLSFTKLFWLFTIGSFFGTIVETLWCIATRGHFEMRVGLVWGPFIPVYGGGAILITLCLYKFHKSHDLVIFTVSAIIGATFEYFASLFQEYFLGTVSWDYTGTPFNIDGRTNLKFALMWGLLGLVWVRHIYPAFCRILEKTPKKIGNVLTIVCLVFMIVNCIVSGYAVYRRTERINNIPAQHKVAEFFDEHFNDEYLEYIYPNMSQVDK